jgi:hypothetical protein
MFLLLLALWFVSLLGIVLAKLRGSDVTTPIFRTITLAAAAPLLYMLFIIANWLYSRRSFARNVVWKRKIRFGRQRHGYEAI